MAGHQPPAAAAWAQAAPEKKGSCRLFSLEPRNVLLVCQLVSMGTRARREWDQMRPFGCGRGVGQTVQQDGKTQLLRLGGTATGIAVARPRNKNSPASSEGWGLYEALGPPGMWRDLLYSQSPLEG